LLASLCAISCVQTRPLLFGFKLSLDLKPKYSAQPTAALKRKEHTMGEGKNLPGYSRRRFLRSGGALLAGAVIGGTSANALSQSRPSADAAPALPWPWSEIDPMEAGSRAYRTYLDAGG
jgi:hypothetical protein